MSVRPSLRPPLALVLIAALLAGCSGGGRIGAGAVPRVPAAPSAPVASAPAATQAVSVQIHVPAASAATSGTARAPAFVSSGTQSVTVAVFTSNPGTTPPAAVPPVSSVTVNLDATTCTFDNGTSGARTCTAQVPAAPTSGSAVDYFLFHTFSAANASGTLLAAAIASNPVIAGQANTVRVALGGVVASLALTPAVASADGALNSTYSIGISAYDASGALIVAGANDPFATPLALGAPSITTDGKTSPGLTTTIVDGTGAVASPSVLLHSSDTIRVAYTAVAGSLTYQYQVNVAAPAYAGLSMARNGQGRSTLSATLPAPSSAQAVFSPIFISVSGTGTPQGTAQPVFSQNGGGTDPTLTFTTAGQSATISASEVSRLVGNKEIAPTLTVTPGSSCANAIGMSQGSSGAYTFSASAVTATTTCPIVVTDANGGSATLEVTNVKSAVTTLSAAQVTAALTDAQTYFQTLPHANIVTDIASVATHMVASGNFTAAVPGPGGITATLPDGTQAVVFADSPESLGLDPQAFARRAAQSARRPDAALSAPTSHEIAFLGNNVDSITFHSMYDGDFSSAFKARFASPNYAVDALPISLDDIVALGTGHPMDFLNVSTHGMVKGTITIMGYGPPYTFTLMSTTPVSDQANLEFKDDVANGTLVPSAALSTGTAELPVTYAFAPAFLTKYLTFNPGAVVDLGACWSSNDLIVADTTATFAKANIGRFYGWSKSTINTDYYESQGFLFDRLLGEQNPALANMAAYAFQRQPAQRAFPLDDVYGAMQTEMRAGPQQAPQSSVPFTDSDKPSKQLINFGQTPILDGDGFVARLRQIDTGFTPAAPLLIRALPSISNLAVVEGPSSGALNIIGRFPATQGSVQIAGLDPAPLVLPITNWTPSHIIATLPNGGNSAAGIVTVTSADGVSSTGVPLTTWSGTLKYVETDRITSLGGFAGNGTGTVAVNLNVNLRADIHPVVPSIDTTPMPQNFAFTNVEGGSTGTLASFGGDFTSLSDAQNAGFAGPEPDPTLLPGSGTAAGTFGLQPVASQPAPCNDGTLGPKSTAGLVFCPSLTFDVPVALTCFDTTNGSLCATPQQPDALGTGSYGVSGSGAGGLLQLTLDPNTLAISVSGPTAGFTSAEFFGPRPASAIVTGSFGSAFFPPSATTISNTARAPIR